MKEGTVDIEALYAALDTQRQQGKLSWRDLAKELEISPSTFTRMAQGRRPDVDTFMALLAWLGVPAEMFMQPSAKPKKQAEPMVMISSYLRTSRNVRPEEAKALEDIIQAAYRMLKSKK